MVQTRSQIIAATKANNHRANWTLDLEKMQRQRSELKEYKKKAYQKITIVDAAAAAAAIAAANTSSIMGDSLMSALNSANSSTVKHVDYVRTYTNVVRHYLDRVPPPFTDKALLQERQHRIDCMTQAFKNMYNFTKDFVTPENKHIENNNGKTLYSSIVTLHNTVCTKPAEFANSVAAYPLLNITELLVAVNALISLYAELKYVPKVTNVKAKV